MIKHIFLFAVGLCPVVPGLTAVAAEPLGSSWTDVTKLPDFFTGNWQSRTSFLDNPSNVPLRPPRLMFRSISRSRTSRLQVQPARPPECRSFSVWVRRSSSFMSRA